MSRGIHPGSQWPAQSGDVWSGGEAITGTTGMTHVL